MSYEEKKHEKLHFMQNVIDRDKNRNNKRKFVIESMNNVFLFFDEQRVDA